jgi:hypothetical protein
MSRTTEDGGITGATRSALVLLGWLLPLAVWVVATTVPAARRNDLVDTTNGNSREHGC